MAASLTRLDAINIILASADMMPVASIETNTTAEARLAITQLDTSHREILNEGWHWNTVWDYSLEANVGSGEVNIPDSVMRFDPRDVPYYVARGDRVYDRLNQTYVINDSVTGMAILYLEWDEMTEEAKTYITKKAARRFHEYHVGSSDALRSLVQDEQEARRLLLDGDMDAGAYNMFDAPDMHGGIGYGNSYVGRASFLGEDPMTNRDAR